MKPAQYEPIVEVWRGPVVESLHYGAAAVVDANGRLVASFGDPYTVTFLRSAAKPYQALPFIEAGGAEEFGLTDREIALICASHSGTDDHVATVRGIQAKTGVQESDLMCGTHPPSHQPTLHRMIRSGEEPTPNRHNCSGKHTAMVASTIMQHLPKADYINLEHPLQRKILTAFAEMTGLDEEQVALGIDGCSAPNFATPLYNAALAFARMADPSRLPDRRAEALQRIWRAMTSNADMVGGPGRFDTQLMDVMGGKLLTKAGAEGFQAVALLPGALGAGSPALGLVLKISDGDAAGRAKTTAVVEALQQLGALSTEQSAALSEFSARPQYNFRRLEVGEIRPALRLVMH
jgi:L-asparaginase II